MAPNLCAQWVSPTRSTQRPGLAYRKGWMDITAPKEGTDAFTTELTLTEDGTFIGKMVGNYQGYNATPERRHHLKEEDKHWAQRLGKRFADVEIEKSACNDALDLGAAF